MHYFVTGISTEVGKTIVSSILVEALQADYWKPIQAGELEHTDTDKVRSLISNPRSQFHPSAFALKTPMSPHAAAVIDNIHMDVNQMKLPKTKNNLIIEGAGGLLVPINDEQTMLDLIPKDAIVVVVSRHYLGSINHTLLTLAQLKEKGFSPKLIYSGTEHSSTEEIISKMSQTPVIGRIDEEPYFDQNVILEYAELFKNRLKE
ncbi:dethiobiotin synthase [Flavobacteriaceae bacterium F08102]|nr:dethiobiotin synthase [Flavobacteriaceae bacterium F08102]